jgi:hypothetical protein
LYKFAIINLIMSFFSLPLVLLVAAEGYFDKTPESSKDALHMLIRKAGQSVSWSMFYIAISILFFTYIVIRRNKGPAK